jgi:hypothetical protein
MPIRLPAADCVCMLHGFLKLGEPLGGRYAEADVASGVQAAGTGKGGPHLTLVLPLGLLRFSLQHD